MDSEKFEAFKVELRNVEATHEKILQKLLNPLTKEQRTELGYPIKGVDTLTRFKANGVNYIVRRSLCISRFEEFEVLQIDVQFGIAIRNMFGNLKKAYEHLNKGTGIADAAVTIYDIMRGIKNRIDKKPHETLLLCSLFICREDEDVTKYDEELNADKIEDWTLEGIDMDSFFHFAFSLAQGFTPDLNQASVSISETMQKVVEKAERLY